MMVCVDVQLDTQERDAGKNYAIQLASMAPVTMECANVMLDTLENHVTKNCAIHRVCVERAIMEFVDVQQVGPVSDAIKKSAIPLVSMVHA